MSDLGRTYGCPACDSGMLGGHCETCSDAGLVTRAQRDAFHDARRAARPSRSPGVLEQTSAMLLASLTDAEREALTERFPANAPPRVVIGSAAVTFDGESGSPSSSSWKDLAEAFALSDETARFRGAVQVLASLDDELPATWRTVGPSSGIYSAVSAISDVRFFLEHPRVTMVRVLKMPDVD